MSHITSQAERDENATCVALPRGNNMKKNLRDLTIKLLAELFMLAVFVTIIVGFIFVMTLILPLEKCICKEVVCITTKGK